MADFTPILDYCTCKFTPIQAYLQIFPPPISHQIPFNPHIPRIKLAFLHGVTTDVFLLNTDNTDNTDRVLCVTTDVFLLNTDNTDFTDRVLCVTTDVFY